MADDKPPSEPDRNLLNQDLARFTPLLSSGEALPPMAERYDVTAIMARCASPAAREFIFRSIDEQRQGLLPAYQLTHFLVEEHQSLCGQPHRPLFDELAASVAAQPGRQRAAKKSNLPLLAVNFTARPETEGERAQCSDLACLLEFALNEGIAPEDYPNWVKTVTLEHALEVIRAKRSAKRDKPEGKKPKTLPPNAVPAIHEVLRGAVAASDGLPSNEVSARTAGIRLSVSIVDGERLIKEYGDFIAGPASFDIVGVLAEAHGRNMIEVLYEIIDVLREPEPPAPD
jgi:hypothetical protein